MPLDISSLLVCPGCRTPLPPPATWPKRGYRCVVCQRTFALHRGIPRFVETEAYADSFGFEWQRHRRTQLDSGPGGESERTFREKTGLTPKAVRGKLVLDVGCGMGRFAEVARRWEAKVVGVDLSLAVESAQANLGARDNVAVVQADSFWLPFPQGSFEVIYSIGVLHHTPDCAAAFRRLVPLVRPGGRLCVWVYGTMGPWQHFARLYRRVTVKLPKRLLHGLCHLAIPWYHVCRLPIVGCLLRTVLPISQHPNPEWRVLDTFDWYSPRYQSLHTFPEVYRWFRSEGFEDITLLDFPVAIAGTRRRG